MKNNSAIAIVGTFDSKAEEHLFLKDAIEKRGLETTMVNVGTMSQCPFSADFDLFPEITENNGLPVSRDKAIAKILLKARELVSALHSSGKISGVISAGGGTGTHLSTGIMHVLPFGVPKVMISTVASRDMSEIVGTKDIVMIHSVVDLLGINSLSGDVLDRAAGAICGMVKREWNCGNEKKRIALTFFGFITKAAEQIKQSLEEKGYEVIPFHANGTGGKTMEELARQGYFDGILDLGTHELADEMMGGYCRGIGDDRLNPVPGLNLPRVVVPGGLDCAVFEFTRDSVPEEFRGRKLFFYDFRSAIRLNLDETLSLANQLSQKNENYNSDLTVLIPKLGWSEADCEGGPLYDPAVSRAFTDELKKGLPAEMDIRQIGLHINDPSFAQLASNVMDEMIRRKI